MAAMDEVSLQGIEVWARHGATIAERERGQPFVLHLTVELDASAAARDDDLSKTVDYGELAQIAADTASGGPFALLETVADRVCAAVLDRFGHAVAVTCTVVKPHAPLPVPAAGASVTMRRERPGR
jgi:7,8-dihydroneopterin aldolase/epimerase/oxygenase